MLGRWRRHDDRKLSAAAGTLIFKPDSKLTAGCCYRFHLDMEVVLLSAVELCSCGIGMTASVSISRLARSGRRWAPATLRRLYARIHPAASAVAVAATAFPLLLLLSVLWFVLVWANECRLDVLKGSSSSMMKDTLFFFLLKSCSPQRTWRSTFVSNGLLPNQLWDWTMIMSWRCRKGRRWSMILSAGAAWQPHQVFENSTCEYSNNTSCISCRLQAVSLAEITFSVPVKLNSSNDRIQLEAGPEEGSVESLPALALQQIGSWSRQGNDQRLISELNYSTPSTL